MTARSRIVLATVVALTAALLVEPPLQPLAAQEEAAPAIERLAGADRIATAVEISRETFPETATAVLARADDFADALVGAPLAAHLQAPILLTLRDRVPPAVDAELERLGVEQVVLLGGEGAIGPAVQTHLEQRYEVDRIFGRDRFATAADIARRLPTETGAFVVTGTGFPDALAVGPWAGHVGRPIVLVGDHVPPATEEVLTERGDDELVIVGGSGAVSREVEAQLAQGRSVRRVAGGSRYDTAAAVFDESVAAGLDGAHVWLATGASFPDALAAGPAVARAGATLLLVDGSDLGTVPSIVERLQVRAESLQTVTLVGGPAAISADAPRQLEVVLAGNLLPRGGTVLFPRFRVVAHYGWPRDGRLGILGQGSAEEAAERLVRHTAPYELPGHPRLPAFELISTIATRGAGSHGHYSNPLDHETIQRYLDAARSVDALLLLDIQPGQSDFLTELRRHERFLFEPDVGVALDPEWRMHGGARPGDHVGWVSADEVNRVSAYLSELTLEHRLPEKLLVLHQFQHQMLRDRDRIAPRPGLAITIHMDGFGSPGAKLSTYRQIRAEAPFTMGFKVFLQQDTNPFTPAQVMGLDPSPAFVSYQ